MKISFDSEDERRDWIFGLITRLHASGWVKSRTEGGEVDDGVNEQSYLIQEYIKETRTPESPE